MRGALGIFDAKARAVAIAEIELGEIAMQVSFAAMLIDALHAALEDREEAFDGVGVNVAANVLASGVAHECVSSELGTELGIEAAFVGVQGALARDVANHDVADVGNGGTVNVERLGATATLDKRHNGTLGGQDRTCRASCAW